MNNTNLFFISYSVLAFSTVFALSLYPGVSIDIYLVFFAIEFFIASELASPFGVFDYHKRIVIEVIMLIIFGVILIERISQIVLEAAL
jgi:hypothetical protein